MHICLDFIPQMLASSELNTQVRLGMNDGREREVFVPLDLDIRI